MFRACLFFALVLFAACSQPTEDTAPPASDTETSEGNIDDVSEDSGDTPSSPTDGIVDDTETPAPSDGIAETGGSSGAVDCDDPDADWLFCEDFERGDGDWQTWFEASDFLTADGGDDRNRIRLSDQYATSGDWSVHMPAAASSNYQGADLTWYACDGDQEVNCDLMGYEKLYFRARVRFAEDHQKVHHFLNIRGMDRFWSYGKAGCMPNGESTMGTTVDFDEGSHETFFYTYHLDMNCDTSCGDYLDVDQWCQNCKEKGFPTCEEQQQCCWGDRFEPDSPAPLPVGEWFCMEMMMEPNTPGSSDGRMAYWIDGELGHSVDGLRWRTTDELQLNQVRLQHYLAEDDADSPNRVWFDDVVVSTERIGCP